MYIYIEQHTNAFAATAAAAAKSTKRIKDKS